MTIEKNIPEPTKRRLIQLEAALAWELRRGEAFISSTALGRKLGVEPHTIRKDINFLGGLGDTASGYKMAVLRDRIRNIMQIDVVKNACIVGLGKLGRALLHDNSFAEAGIRLKAGFDVNVNKLETLQADIQLFPAYEMEDIIKSRQIEVAVLATPAESAEETLAILENAGVRAVLNYTGAVLPGKTERGAIVSNMNLGIELKMIKNLMMNQ